MCLVFRSRSSTVTGSVHGGSRHSETPRTLPGSGKDFRFDHTDHTNHSSTFPTLSSDLFSRQGFPDPVSVRLGMTLGPALVSTVGTSLGDGVVLSSPSTGTTGPSER